MNDGGARPSPPDAFDGLLLVGDPQRRLDRRSAERADALTEALARPDTVVIDVCGEFVAVAPVAALHRRALRAADADALVCYLGRFPDGVDHVAVVHDEVPDGSSTVDGTGSDDCEWVSLRQVAATLGAAEAGLATTAIGIGNWHRRHRHCPACGAATIAVDGGWTRRCVADGSLHFPRTDPAVIMAIVDADDRLLLARGPAFTETGMSVLAGFVEPGETLADAVRREIAEEVGVLVGEVRYRGDQPWPFPASLMIGFTGVAETTELTLQEGEIVAADWFSRSELAAALAAGTLTIPGPISISRRLIEDWYGAPLPDDGAPLLR